MPSTPVSRLFVRRLCNSCLVPGDHPAPKNMAERLSDAARRSLPGAMGRILRSAFPAADTTVWFIRRLDMELDVDNSLDTDELGRAMAAQMARQILRSCAAADGDNVVRFADRAAYLARYLTDRAGAAANAWYYAEFDGLKPLPVSAALAGAICTDPVTAEAALRRLDHASREQVLGRLTPLDAERVLGALAANPADADEISVERAWLTWKRRAASTDASPAQDALRIYLATDSACPSFAAAARAVVCLVVKLRSSTADGAAQLIEILRGRDAAALRRAVGDADARTLSPLASMPPAWLGDVAQAVRHLGVGSPVAAASGRTNFGGAFLLLPMLEELPIELGAADWPDAGDTPAAALIRLLVLAKCFGPARADQVFFDPIIRQLAGVDDQLQLPAIAQWTTQIAPRHCRRLLRTIDDWRDQRGDFASSASLLVRTGLDAKPMAVWLGGARAIIRMLAPLNPAKPGQAIRRLCHRVEPAVDSLMVADPLFVQPLRSLRPRLQVASLDSAFDVGSQAAQQASAIETLEQDLQSLPLPAEWRVGDARDHALSQIAQGLLRSFAWRLPGFGRCSFEHLRSNLLDFTATIEDQPERRLVRIARPPLGILLDITGMSNARFVVPRIGDRPFSLFPQV